MNPRTITGALKKAQREFGTPGLDAQVLLSYALGKDKAWLLAHSDESLSAEEEERWEAALGTYLAGVPLPYVLGEWEFYGLMLNVTPAVLIPRPETELLVEAGLNRLATHTGQKRALDVGTGSGCIAIALAANHPDVQVVATDISPLALEVANANVDRLKLASRIELVETNLMDGITGPFDLICGNLPYIPDKSLPDLQVSKWEPRLALGGGSDGLYFIRPFLQQAATRLAVPGIVLAETDASLEEAVIALAGSIWPEGNIEVRKDLASLPRLLVVET